MGGCGSSEGFTSPVVLVVARCDNGKQRTRSSLSGAGHISISEDSKDSQGALCIGNGGGGSGDEERVGRRRRV